ncbi:MAG: hypothetical protein V1747_07060 [Candidatus Omnitrophota bacterium]
MILNNNIIARYTHGPSIDEPLILEKSAKTTAKTTGSQQRQQERQQRKDNRVRPPH